MAVYFIVLGALLTFLNLFSLTQSFSKSRAYFKGHQTPLNLLKPNSPPENWSPSTAVNPQLVQMSALVDLKQQDEKEPTPQEQIEAFTEKLVNFFKFPQPPAVVQVAAAPNPVIKPVIDLTIYDKDISAALAVLVVAAETKAENSDAVVDSLLSLEKLMRAKNKLDEGATSIETLKYLNGKWRLIFTTGTVDTQKKMGGRINYFPLKAVQSFNTETKAISNAIYIGDFPVFKFFGEFDWIEKARKLEFDFDAVSVVGVKFKLPKGKAAELGSATGLGSENNLELVNKGRKPFFNWISADSSIATARGGGGGLALWKRIE